MTPRAELAARWAELLPGEPAMGQRLLARWSEPHRRHHDAAHLLEVLQAVDLLDQEADDPDAVRLAGWFHDAVYAGRPDDELRSAALAAEELGPVLAAPLVAQVGALVLMTREHDPADADGRVLSDADLCVLAAPPARYRAYARAVRAEHPRVDDAAFTRGRTQVLRALLDRPRLFHTGLGRARWERAARRQVAGELAALTAGPG